LCTKCNRENSLCKDCLAPSSSLPPSPPSSLLSSLSSSSSSSLPTPVPKKRKKGAAPAPPPPPKKRRRGTATVLGWEPVHSEYRLGGWKITNPVTRRKLHLWKLKQAPPRKGGKPTEVAFNVLRKPSLVDPMEPDKEQVGLYVATFKRIRPSYAKIQSTSFICWFAFLPFCLFVCLHANVRTCSFTFAACV
jgi:hypothetical protein